MAKAIDHNFSDLSLSRNTTIRRRCRSFREKESEMNKNNFAREGFLLLHWDGKVLQDITGGVLTTERVAVIVTGEEEKFLAQAERNKLVHV